jgi:transposase
MSGELKEGCPVGRPAKYPEEFRESAVAMVRETGKPIARVARDLGINEGPSATESLQTGDAVASSGRSR